MSCRRVLMYSTYWYPYLKTLWPALIIRICCTSIAQAVDLIDCTNADQVTSIFNGPIGLTFSGTIHVYENVSIEGISGSTNNEFDKNYIDARLELDMESGRKNLTIYTTEHFPRYAEEQTAARITLKILYSCDMERTRTLLFFQPVRLLGSEFRPTFSQQVYVINLSTPIFKGFDLTIFTETPISAQADELSKGIVFSSEDAALFGISVGIQNITNTTTPASTTGRDNRTNYFASLTLNRVYLTPPEEFTFHIVATNNDASALSSNATVLVRADPKGHQLSVRPQFQRMLYHGVLSTNLTLQPLIVRLLPETYAISVHFSVTGMDGQLFLLTNNADVVEVHLAKVLLKEDIRDKKYLELEIRAENTQLADYGTTAIVVEVPSLKEHFRFDKSLYEGFIDIAGNLELAEIVFNAYAYTDEVIFELRGAPQELTISRNRKNILTLFITQREDEKEQDQEEFSAGAWSNETFVIFEVVAKWKGLNDATSICLKLPRQIIVSMVPQPEFEQPLYLGSIDENYELHMDTIMLVTDTYVANKTDFHLAGNESDLFDLEIDANSVQLRLKPAEGPFAPYIPATVYLTLLAQTNQSKTYASVVLKTVAAAVYVHESERIFESAWYEGNIMFPGAEEQVLNLDAIAISPGHSVNEFVFTLEGAEAEFFAVAVDGINDKVYLSVLEDLTAEILDTKRHILLQLNAIKITNTDFNGTAVVFIELPGKDCTTPAPTAFLPEFYSSAYIFAAKPHQLGSLGQVHASVPGSNATIRYSISVEDAHLKKRLTINTHTGELMLLSYVSPGVYYFSINAENEETFDKATTVARLDVSAMLQCDGQRVAVSNALIVKHIQEEEEHANLLNATVEDCSFKIVHMQPDDKVYVYINESTKMLSTIAIDREDEVFQHMTEPQVQVWLQLICANDAQNEMNGSRRVRRAANYSFVLTTDIRQTQDMTQLNLIIVDINDNPPTFTYPSTPTYLAYPDSSICLQLFPPYLTQVQARDPDAGLNALIRYTMRPNRHFGIDAVSGVVYPKSNALLTESYTELLVLATDRAGADDGLSAGTVLFVKRLSADYFSLLTFQSHEPQMLPDALSNLTNATGYAVTVVKSATIAGNAQIAGKKFQSSQHARQALAVNQVIQKAWVYAFDAKEPVKCEQLQDKILELPIAGNFVAVETYAAVGLASNHSGTTIPAPLAPALAPSLQDDSTAHIVAIAVLASMCAACIGFLVWQNFLHQRFCTRHATKCTGNKDTHTPPLTTLSAVYSVQQCDRVMPEATLPFSQDTKETGATAGGVCSLQGA